MGRHVMVANFTGGNVAVLPIREDGTLRPATDVVQHSALGTDAPSDKKSHAHSIILDPTKRFAIAADLGLDCLMVYQLDPDKGKLVPHTRPRIKVRDGAGPRHLDFHPGGQYAYLINELNGTIIAYAFDPQEGTFEELQTVPTLPEGYTGHVQCADVHVAPSGKFVYGSNRGHDSLVIYAIDQTSGHLTYVGHEPTRGKTPRNFAIDPSGVFLFAANQDSGNIVTFRIERETGKLSPTGQVTEVPAPVCIKIHAPYRQTRAAN
jgi:6-phosphogluconolactonase